MELEFSQLVQKEADSSGREMTADIIWSLYAAEYLNITAPYELVSFENAQASRSTETERVNAKVRCNGEVHEISGRGNGPISAMVTALRDNFGLQFKLADFGQNTRSSTSKAEAAAYVELKNSGEICLWAVLTIYHQSPYSGVDVCDKQALIPAVLAAQDAPQFFDIGDDLIGYPSDLFLAKGISRGCSLTFRAIDLCLSSMPLP